MPCNTIYPDESLRRWEVCQSIDILTNYYTKQQIDEKLDDIVVSGSGVTVDEVQEIVDENLEDYYTKEEIDSGFTTVNNELDTKLDASAYTPTDLSNYYTKQQTNGLLDNKLDASAYTPTDLSNYWTSAQTVDYVDTAISGIPSNILAVDWEGLTSNMNDDKWDSLVDAFQNNNPIYAIVDYSGEGFIDIDQKPIDGYVFIDGNTGEQGSRIELKRLTGGGYDWITITKNGSNDYTVTNGNVQYTPTDLSNYWTSAQTQNAIDDAISGITGITIDQSLDSGSTNAVSNSAITNALDTKADVTNVYNKTEVNNLINNKIICLTQNEYDSLVTKQSGTLYLIYEV